MPYYYMVAFALLPACVLLYYIYRRDKYQHEPVEELLKDAAWGMNSALMALVFAFPYMSLGLPGEGDGAVGCMCSAFLGAAIPEECAKALCLGWFLHRNKYFDEYVDGIVYAVAVGMGFAGLENILYVFGSEAWFSTSVVRAVLSVPAHFAFAVLMGYFYSLCRIKKNNINLLWMLLAPILAHGVFDFLLMYMPFSENWIVLLVLGFFVFVYLLHRLCNSLIRKHLDKDRQVLESKGIVPTE